MTAQYVSGSLHVTVEALDGWARVCVTDVYELEFRYNNQKHVTIVNIARDKQRVFTNNQFSMHVTDNSTTNQCICVRIRELKTGWTRRHVTVGHTSLDTCELMRVCCARPQLISLNANSSGSLKLRLRVLWTPNQTCYANVVRTKSVVERTDSWSPISRLSIHDNIMKSLSSLMCDNEDNDNSNSDVNCNESDIHFNEKRTVF